MEEKDELIELVNELVSKAGPTVGQIKLNQDPVKVERLLALGYKPKEPTEKTVQEESRIIERLEALENTSVDHEKRLKACEVRR